MHYTHALANTCLFLSSIFWGWTSDRIGRRWAIMIPAMVGVPTAFLYLVPQDYTLIVIGFALQGLFACGGMHVQYPAYLSERFPTEVRATAVAFFFHQGAIWGGLIAPLLVWYATTVRVSPRKRDSVADQRGDRVRAVIRRDVDAGGALVLARKDIARPERMR